MEKKQSIGNETTINALIHATGLFIEPGASKNIGASAAAKRPGSARTPQTTVTITASVGRDIRTA